MAAPPEKNLDNLSGIWVLNKQLSTPLDEVLAVQGVPWILRKAIGLASSTERWEQFRDENGIEHVNFVMTITGGIKTTPEYRVHDDKWAPDYNDPIVGKSRARHRRVKISSLKEDDPVESLLKTGWTQETVDGDELIDGIIESLAHGWVTRMACGFEDYGGERKFVRRMVATKGSQVKSSKMVFDYKGPLPDKQ